jgi:hypothetical protein
MLTNRISKALLLSTWLIIKLEATKLLLDRDDLVLDRDNRDGCTTLHSLDHRACFYRIISAIDLLLERMLTPMLRTIEAI